MTRGDKLLGEFLKVIDFTVENHDYAAVFIEKRLLPAGDIHDRKTAMTETNAGLRIDLSFIWSAVNLGLIHAPEQMLVNFSFSAGIK
jgi:hypothetical protein